MIVTDRTIRRVPSIGGEGVTKLSELEIDVDKDWAGRVIKNLGAPVDASDAIRKIDLDAHRVTSPIDHPDGSITRNKLEYPTQDVSFAYLASINKVRYCSFMELSYLVVARDSFTDKAVWAVVQPNTIPKVVGRLQNKNNTYFSWCHIPPVTRDHILTRIDNRRWVDLAVEAIDLDLSGRGLAISISGSVVKSLRYELPSPVDPLELPPPNVTISAVDTTFASGFYGFRPMRENSPHGASESGSVWLKFPMSPVPPAQAILEFDIEDTGNSNDPFTPSMSKDLVEISSLTGLPDFLYREAKRYNILKAKGLTDEEMELLLGYVPQHQVDLNAVTWGVFEFNPDKDSTVVVTTTRDNPYKPGAIERQKEGAEEWWRPPRNYSEAVELYKQMKKDHPYWLAGKDSFAYQVLGLEVLDYMQNVDFYYGELIEHKTHYSQLKQVSDEEIHNRINELIDKLSKAEGLYRERRKHIAKAREILRRGW